MASRALDDVIDLRHFDPRSDPPDPEITPVALYLHHERREIVRGPSALIGTSQGLRGSCLTSMPSLCFTVRKYCIFCPITQDQPVSRGPHIRNEPPAVYRPASIVTSELRTSIASPPPSTLTASFTRASTPESLSLGGLIRVPRLSRGSRVARLLLQPHLDPRIDPRASIARRQPQTRAPLSRNRCPSMVHAPRSQGARPAAEICELQRMQVLLNRSGIGRRLPPEAQIDALLTFERRGHGYLKEGKGVVYLNRLEHQMVWKVGESTDVVRRRREYRQCDKHRWFYAFHVKKRLLAERVIQLTLLSNANGGQRFRFRNPCLCLRRHREYVSFSQQKSADDIVLLILQCLALIGETNVICEKLVN
ncbi:hypothetical protein K438DRAFT_1983787 [Mycena galopus ATCC 62051]|nr:hypothetical protein K438DRAFT_1983787 [Mycena galopus ATCC 62051]